MPIAAESAEFTPDSAAIGAASLTVARAPGALDCPSAERLRADLEPLGIDAASVEPVSIRIEIRLAEHGYEAFVSVPGADGGVRDLRAEGPGCGRLEADLTAALALLLDRRRTAAPPVASAEQAPPTAPPPTPNKNRPKSPPAEATARKASPRDEAATSPSALHGRVALGGGAALAVVGTAAASVEAAFWLENADFSLGLHAFSTFDATNELGAGSVAVRLMGGRLDGCLPLFGARHSVHGLLCAEAALGALRGAAHGYVITESAAYRPWFALGGGATVGGPIAQRWAWSADATALIPLHRESFSIPPLGVAFETPLVGVLLSLGLSLQIW